VTKISQHDLEALIAQFEQSDWKTLELISDDLEIFLSKDAASTSSRHPDANPRRQPLASERTPVSQPEAPPGPANEWPANWQTVRAPSLGMFYRSRKPGSPPLTEIGAAVDEDTELCLIEVMKLFTSLRAGVAGIVREVLVKDGELVEFDQPLFIIEPHG
jgi:acetyl-CoA carboxylase biotin carboxyl carrier protein